MTRILIIDDNDLIRTLVHDMLQDAGYEVREASDGLEGMSIFQTQLVDLVITDLMMPRQGGFATIQALRQHDPEAKIIAMSGSSKGPNSPLAVAVRLGAEQALHKPFTSHDLLLAVQRALAHADHPQRA